MNAVVAARDLVAELFPQARWALLTGSVLIKTRAAVSDLDIVVVLPDGDPKAPRHASRRFRGWPVELFVHDEQTLAHHLATELGARKPSLHRVVGTGVWLVGEPGQWPQRCAKVLSGEARTPSSVRRSRSSEAVAGEGRRPRLRRPSPSRPRARARVLPR